MSTSQSALISAGTTFWTSAMAAFSRSTCFFTSSGLLFDRFWPSCSYFLARSQYAAAPCPLKLADSLGDGLADAPGEAERVVVVPPRVVAAAPAGDVVVPAAVFLLHDTATRATDNRTKPSTR